MLAFKGTRAADAQAFIDYIKGRSWGMMILDEVQTAPAEEFRQLLTKIPSHCKLGLTATLVREDGKITVCAPLCHCLVLEDAQDNVLAHPPSSP